MRLAGIPYGPLPRPAQPGSDGAVPAIPLSQPSIVVVHCTGHGRALDIATAAQEAHYAAARTDPRSRWTSAHAYVDEHGPVGSLPLDLQAWSARAWANHNGWHVELCGPEDGVPEQTQRAGARLVRQLCQLGAIPITHLDGPAVRSMVATGRGAGGITGHVDITDAGVDGNDHTDPGRTFDWDRFTGWVREADTMTALDEAATSYQALIWRMDALMSGADTVRGGPYAGEPMWLVQRLKALTGAGRTPEQIAELLRPVLGDQAAAVGAALIGPAGTG